MSKEKKPLKTEQRGYALVELMKDPEFQKHNIKRVDGVPWFTVPVFKNYLEKDAEMKELFVMKKTERIEESVRVA